MSYDIQQLKSGGFMKQKEKDFFSLRLRIVGGFVTSAQVRKLAEIADKYAKGHLHLTTRQGVEIPNVNFKDFEAVQNALREVGLSMGACGQRVRTVTACQGALCTHGLIDCLKLAKEIDEKYFGLGGYPHKFKIAITGCPNGCIKPQENDFGIMGRITKKFLRESCNYCGLCAEICPVDAIKIEKESEKLIFDAKKCIGCGDCVYSCPTSAWEKREQGYTIFVGGKMGKFPALGVQTEEFVKTKEDLMDILRRTMEFYKNDGKRGERFRDTLDRVGVEKYIEKISMKRQ